MAKTNFRNEIERLNKGVRFAWMINFILLWMVLIAGGIFLTLKGSNVTNEEVIHQVLFLIIITLPIALITMFFVSHKATKILLSAPQGGAVQIIDGVLYNIVEEISIAARLNPLPKVYVLQGSGVANAYAIADNHGNSQVVVTEELLNQLHTREELEGVIAHEIGHIISGDSQAMTKLIALTSTTAIIAGFATRMIYTKNGNNKNSNPLAIVLIVISLIFLLVAPFLSKLAETYMSRERESRADATAVKLTRNPTGLAKALETLEKNTKITSSNKESLKTFGKTIGPMAFFNPSGLKINLSTHPSTKKRLSDLKNMGADININEE